MFKINIFKIYNSKFTSCNSN